jgi:hypothetical protein
MVATVTVTLAPTGVKMHLQSSPHCQNFQLGTEQRESASTRRGGAQHDWQGRGPAQPELSARLLDR